MRALLCCVSVELTATRRDDGRAWYCCGPFDRSPLGDQTIAATGKSVPAVQTHGRQKLEDGRDIHSNRGEWRYLYRAVDKAGNTIDFLLRARRDKAVAQAYFERAVALNGDAETVTIDKSGSNLAALKAINANREIQIKIRQQKYLNNIVEQDHRAIKRRMRPMMGFKNFHCARIILGGIETMHMIRKGQMNGCAKALSPAQQFNSLVS